MDQADGTYWWYGYGGRGRLTGAIRRNASNQIVDWYVYTYDAADNLTQMGKYNAPSNTTDMWVYAYNNANEQTGMTLNGGTPETRTYNAWGRLATRAQGSYAASYAYRYGGRLYSQTSNFPGEGNVTLQYRGDGRLYGRTDASTSVRYRYDAGWNPLVETDASGNVQRTNVYLPGSSRAPLLMSSLGTLGAGTPMYAYRDHLDSVRRWRISNKNSLQANEFDPYGKLYAGTTYFHPAVFALHPYDPAMAAYRAPYRNYSPTMARWMTRDPLGMVDGPNVYGYAQDNPVSTVDELGLECCSSHEIALRIARATASCSLCLKYSLLAGKSCSACAACTAASGPSPFQALCIFSCLSCAKDATLATIHCTKCVFRLVKLIKCYIN